MSQEVIIKKSDTGYYAVIPYLGICEHSPSLEESYGTALKKAEAVKGQFSALHLTHLLPQTKDHLILKLTTKKTLKMYALGVGLIMISVSLIGLTIKKSIDRATYSLNQSLFKDDPERVEKNREKFRELLVKYKPLIDEWKKATK
jgi:hypothetical protein